VPVEKRNPWIALILSFLFCGRGQWYNGRTWDGLKFFGAFAAVYFLALVFTGMSASPNLSIAIIFAILSFLIVVGIWIYEMYDAYTTAEKINMGDLEFTGEQIILVPDSFVNPVRGFNYCCSGYCRIHFWNGGKCSQHKSSLIFSEIERKMDDRDRSLHQ